MLFSLIGNAQQNQEVTPYGIFDNVFDRFGNKYKLNDIAIDTEPDSNGVQKSVMLCTGGYFDLYFESGCGMDGNSSTEIARRNVLCQVFSDLSNFITPANPSVRVNIWVRNIANIVPNPSTSGVLGLASGFHTVPSGASNFSGIVDNEIWKTINSGTNSYTNVASPLNSLSGAGASFYHGIVAFNFANSTINWHTNLSQTTLSGLYDMYTITLHEAIHALGFASLIDANGDSKLGTNYKYYSRYDLFLRTSTNVPLITNTGACSLYNFGFNPSISSNVMTPSPFNCTTHIQFAGTVNQATYSPSTFAPPSSLSHLEDICHTPTAFSNDQYYVMSDANGTGATFMKRYLKSEERKVLCDIGYKVNTTYGNNANLNFFNYGGSTCPGLQVAGINDGINLSGFFQYAVTVGSTIQVSGILSNDFNAVSFECLQDIYGNGTVSTTSGTNFNYTANTPGLALLRYIPVSSSGNRGNITYIYIYVLNGNCTPNACDIVSNGGFENSLNCGQMENLNEVPPPSINCWSSFSRSPDLFVRNCIPLNNSNMTVPTIFCNPASDTWNMGASGNNKMLGLWSKHNTWNEGIQNILSSPIQGNASVNYVLTFRARVTNNFFGAQNLPATLVFAGSQNMLAPIWPWFNSTPASLSTIASQVVPNNNQWNYFSIPFTNSNAFSLNYLTIINAAYATSNPPNHSTNVLIDDISILVAGTSPTFTPPSPLCINQTISDLSLFTSTPGGTFSGNGVVLSSGIYSFNASVAGAGTHLITYTYTTNSGCIQNVSTNITVLNSNINLSVAANPSDICIGESSTLTATGATTYLWDSGNFSGNPYVVSPTTTTTYFVTGTNTAGCSATAQVTVNVDSSAPLCCAASTLTIPNGSISSDLGSIPSGSVIDVLGLLTVNSNFSLTSCTLRMAPNAKIDVLSGNTFSLSGCIVFSCTDMWDGIYSNPGANVNITLSRIEDATNAIYSFNGGSYKLDFNIFNKNNISLFVDNFNSPHTGIVRKCVFECVATNSVTPGATLKAPMTGQISHYGIYCRNNADITFGQVSAQPNTFRNIEIGIYALKTRLKVYRNNFSNINQSYCFPNFPPTSTCPIKGWPIWVQNCLLTVGDPTGTSHENNFTNCSNGILIDGKSSFNIQKNNFTNIVTSGFLGNLIYSKCIYSRFNSGDFTGIIHDNVFTNFEAGIYYQANNLSLLSVLRNKLSNFNINNGTAIYLLQNQAHPIQIKNNLINQLPTHSGWYGIRVQNAVQAGNNVLIAENTINNVRHGIWTTNYDNITIKDQTAAFNSIGSYQAGIYYPNSVPSVLSVGIKVENCPKTNLFNNLIQKASSNPTTSFTNMLYGISIETNSIGTNVQENEVRRMGKGLNFYGTPNGPLSVSCNKIYQNRTGVSLNNTFIGDQGMPNPSGIAQDNQWSIPGNISSNWLGAERIGSSPTTTWYTRSTALPFFPNTNLQMQPTMAISNGNALGAPYNCNFGCANPPCNNVTIKKMISKEPPFDNLNNDANQIVDMKVYELLKKEPAYTTSGTVDDSLFIAYRDSLAPTNIGKLYEFTEKLEIGDTAGAYNSLMEVNPIHCAEVSQKIIYEIYWKTWAKNIFEFESQDSLLLYQIAEQKPHVCGTAVYDARVMLGLDFNDFEEAQLKMSNPDINDEINVWDEEGKLKIILYPNPAEDFIMYKSDISDNENAFLIIYNMLGEDIHTEKISLQQQEGRIDLSSFVSGMYLYKIYINNAPISTGPIVIRK